VQSFKEICNTELTNSQDWPIAMYRTNELANPTDFTVGDTFLVFWSTFQWSGQFYEVWWFGSLFVCKYQQKLNPKL
jgi:hypothetical protein